MEKDLRLKRVLQVVASKYWLKELITREDLSSSKKVDIIFECMQEFGIKDDDLDDIFQDVMEYYEIQKLEKLFSDDEEVEMIKEGENKEYLKMVDYIYKKIKSMKK